MSENSFFKDFIESWNDPNPEYLLSFYHDDIFYKDPITSKGVKGKKALREYLLDTDDNISRWTWEFSQYYKTKDDRYFVKWKATVQIYDRLVIEEGLDIIEFYDHRIILHEVYFDKSKILSVPFLLVIVGRNFKASLLICKFSKVFVLICL